MLALAGLVQSIGHIAVPLDMDDLYEMGLSAESADTVVQQQFDTTVGDESGMRWVSQRIYMHPCGSVPLNTEEQVLANCAEQGRCHRSRVGAT